MRRRKSIERLKAKPRPEPAGSKGPPHRRHATLAAAINRAARKSTQQKSTVSKVETAGPHEKSGREDLREQLLAAEARIMELEGRLAAVTDRIAWIADRLHSLLEDNE